MNFSWPDFVFTALVVLPIVLVLIGSTLQMATGVGLGLISGPGLLLVLPGSSAVQAAVFLNLSLSLLVLPSEIKQADKSRFYKILLWSALGIPLGIWLLLLLSAAWLKIFSGILIILAAVQMRLVASGHLKNNLGQLGKIVGSIGSGVMTGALAVPGPLGLWVLLNDKLDATTVRATMRVFFSAVYLLALILNLATYGFLEDTIPTLLILMPAMLIGIYVGHIIKNKVSSEILLSFFEKMLILMGASLLIKGCLDVF